MSALYLCFPSDEAAQHFVATHAGFEHVPGANGFDALYGDDHVDGRDRNGFSGEVRVPPRRGIGGSPQPAMPTSDMPQPWPVIVGYDGMSSADAGIAMKAHHGVWVPVERFEPPLSPTEQAAANEAAMSRYVDRCAEHSVMGSAAPFTLSAKP